MIQEKIKQRLLGLLGVCIILMAFVPVLLEEPETFLTISPTLVPLKPDISEASVLFETTLPQGASLREVVHVDRDAYNNALQALSSKESIETSKESIENFEVGLPLSYLQEKSSAQAMEGDAKPAQAHFALPRATAIRFMQNTDAAQLERVQLELDKQRLRSFLISEKPASVSANEAQGVMAVLYVGPFLRRQDAEEALKKLRLQYPEQTPMIERFVPGES